MLTDPVAVAIVQEARQSGLRRADRPREPFHTIFADFLTDVVFPGRRFIDLGPGHFDFADLARQRGAETFSLDHDPAVLELGRYLDFPVAPCELKILAETHLPAVHGFPERFDGVFCKYSVNAFWFSDPEELRRHIAAICRFRADGGWGWIAPWNGCASDDELARCMNEEQRSSLASAQTAFFVENGWSAFELTAEQAGRYGVSGTTFNRMLFTCNLRVPPDLIPAV